MSSRVNISMRILLAIAITVGALLAVTVPAFAAVPTANFVGYGAFSGSQTIAAGEAINFEDKSTQTPNAWAWTFGDGETSITQNPVHTYADAGTYTVTLVATNASGSSTMVTKTNYITVLASMSHTVNLSLTPASQAVVGPPTSPTFTVTIAVTPSTGQAVSGIDTFVSFDPAVLQVDSILPATGNLLTTEMMNTWDNDAGWLNYSAGKTTAPFPTATFNLAVITMHAIGAGPGTPLSLSFITDAGAGQVTMAALNGANETGTLTGATVTVQVQPTADFTAAGAVSGNTTVAAGETVNFTDTTTGGPTEWDWDFDTSTPSTDSTSQNPTNVYTVAGQYTVRLTATNVIGNDTMTKTNYITVVPAALDHIDVTPSSQSLQVNGSQTFTAATFDVYDNARTGDTIVWSVGNATAGSINSGTGAFTAGTVAGTYTNVIIATSGAVAGNASVTVGAGALDHITVSPDSPTVQAGGGSVGYSAATFDQYNNARTGDPIVWSVTAPAAGSINSSSGMFTAGTVADHYNNVIVATSGAFTGNASVTVTPGPLATITVSPASPSVVVAGSQTYTAATFDQFNNARTGDTIAWSVTNATAGSINAGTGVLTAGTVTGTYNNVVVATSGAITGNASVVLTPGPLHHITVNPSNPTVGITASQTFTAVGYDQFNNARTGDTFTWSVAGASAAAGAINATTGVFTATSILADVGDYSNAIVATSGAITGNASVSVVGGIIDGTVTLQGASRPAAKRLVNVTVKTFATGTTNTALRLGTGALGTYTGTTVDTGSNVVTFQVVGLVPGTWDITIDSGHTLMNVKKNVVISGGNNAVTFGTLLEGDCNDDGQVTAIDFSTLASSYMKSTGQAGWNATADFDGTGQVNSLDFSLLAANYLKTSPQTAP